MALHNRSRERSSGNPYRWDLYKLVDGAWFRIEPWAVPAPAATVAPGDTDESSLDLYHGDPVDCDGSRTVGHFGGGRYACHVGFGRGGETHVALFEFDAPSIQPEPDDVAIERDGEELLVTTPAWHDEDHPPRAELDFERVDGGADHRLIPEQLFRRPMRGFGNALPLFEAGVERLRLRANRHVVGGAVGYDDLRRRVAYEDETFRVEGEDPLRG